MRRRLAVVSALLVGVGSLTLAGGGPVGASGFSDVGPGHRFAVPVDWAVWEGVTAGYDDGSFRPTAPVSRQALAAFLARVESAELEGCAAAPFADVGMSHRFCAEISWLVAEGISGGYVDGTFRPTVVISRQAMAAFLYRVAGPGDPDPACGPGGGPFPDVGSSHAFCGEIEWLADAGISGGYPDGTFRPTAPVSRQAAVSFLWSIAGSPTGALRIASAAADGTPGLTNSSEPDVTPDGRHVAFQSGAANLVPGDTNAGQDVFVRDLVAGTIERVSVASDGSEGDGASSVPSISADGRYVAFESAAGNLVAGDDNEGFDVFVHDRSTGVTERVSVASGGAEAGAGSRAPSISADGRYVAFQSTAADLVPGDTNDLNDVFVHDRQTGATERVSVTAGGAQGSGTSNGADISADGRYVAFATTAGNLSPPGAIGTAVVVRDRTTGTITPVSVTEEGAGTQTSDEASISADGRYVAFASFADDLVPGDDEGHQDAFVRDLVTGTTQRLSVGAGGVGGDATSRTPRISADGRHIVFVSDATNLVAGDTNGRRDAFLWDRDTGSLERVSTSLAGVEGNGDTQRVVTSDGAATVALATSAWNLVTGDGNFARDVIVRRTFGAG